MRLSIEWLQEWTQPEVSASELAAQLTMAGLEVDSVETAAPAFSQVVVGEVVSAEPHPDADKLQVCSVKIAKNKPALTIVCGASNARAGLKVAVATVGCVLPNGLKIKRAKIRGVESFGMLCAEEELGLADASEGILELPEDAPIGMDLRDYLGLDDQIIEIDLTPNRGDCLGVAGLAREVGVLNRCRVKVPKFKEVEQSHKQKFTIEVDEPAACPRYLGRVVTGVNAQAATPLWMKERLRRCGIRSLGPLVDVTNYVLLEYGQPMHAFDLATLHDEIRVRMARKNETMTLLDGKEIKLDPDVLLIADSKGPLALAGVMGGEGSGISDSTTDVFLECAFFAPDAIIGKARRYGLQTDSSYRFERGVDPEIQQQAMERATQLLIDIAGGEAGPVIEKASKKDLPKAKPIKLHQAQIARLLGADIPAKEISDILKRLGMDVDKKDDGKKGNTWKVVAPTFRFDISREADLIEEVGRIYGYNNIPRRMPSGDMVMRSQPENRLGLNRVKDLLVDRGYQEVITYSFVEPKQQALLDPNAQQIALANPLSADMSVMRTNLWTGLINTVRHNLNRQQARVFVFETGMSFVEHKGKLTQRIKIAGACAGSALPEQWHEQPRPVDFFDVKADVEAILALTGAASDFSFAADPHPVLHPGQSARLIRAGQDLGWLGKLHPEILRKQELTEEVLLFEMDWANLQDASIPVFKALSKFPSIRRDLSIVVDEAVSVAQIWDVVRGIVPNQLQEIRLFDVYRGKGVDSGRKSLSFGLILQESSRTLVDQEVDSTIEKIVGSLNQKLGASLRE